MRKKLYGLSLILIVIDQVIKVIVSKTITLNTSIKIIPNFFYLANVHNDGAAFSMFSGNRIFLILITLIALVMIYLFFIKGKELAKMDIVLTSMLLGGIVGNFIDRIIYGYVVDYLEFIIFGYHFPIFNFADICIVVSVVTMLLLSMKEELCKSLKSKKKQEE